MLTTGPTSFNSRYQFSLFLKYTTYIEINEPIYCLNFFLENANVFLFLIVYCVLIFVLNVEFYVEIKVFW